MSILTFFHWCTLKFVIKLKCAWTVPEIFVIEVWSCPKSPHFDTFLDPNFFCIVHISQAECTLCDRLMTRGCSGRPNLPLIGRLAWLHKIDVLRIHIHLLPIATSAGPQIHLLPNSFLGTFVPKSKSSMELSFPWAENRGTFAPRLKNAASVTIMRMCA